MLLLEPPLQSSYNFSRVEECHNTLPGGGNRSSPNGDPDIDPPTSCFFLPTARQLGLRGRCSRAVATPSWPPPQGRSRGIWSNEFSSRGRGNGGTWTTPSSAQDSGPTLKSAASNTQTGIAGDLRTGCCRFPPVSAGKPGQTRSCEFSRTGLPLCHLRRRGHQKRT